MESKANAGKIYFKFNVDSKFKDVLKVLFDEERKQLYLRNIGTYKALSEIEAKIIKLAGSNLAEILLFGSVAKGRDTSDSDIDICLLIRKEDKSLRQSIRTLSLDNKSEHEVQIHIFTLEEFMLARRNKNPLVEDILKDGLSLKIGK